MSDVILQQILAELQGVKSEINGMKSEIAGIKSDVKNLQSEFATFKSEIVGELVIIKDDIESIKEDTKLIPLIQQAVSEVNTEVVAGRDSLERIDRSLRGHDATLDILARRSIDQEAEMKRLAASA
ncbi:histidine kinase [Paenibacillus sp. FSL R7-0333]|uniref:histidine kinase n=1 Tax=Paenibacillus sp. FSL R7-0333 TaxID=1926587 RepID=UPI00096E628E|nr:histidine kinase [Paenibacillus sp. FSL R7-0333]